MTVEALMEEIRSLPVAQRKRLITLIVDTLVDSPPVRKRSILEFEGIAAHLRDENVDAQEYVNQLRSEWDHRP
jgi:hypothetical protein